MFTVTEPPGTSLPPESTSLTVWLPLLPLTTHRPNCVTVIGAPPTANRKPTQPLKLLRSVPKVTELASAVLPDPLVQV